MTATILAPRRPGEDGRVTTFLEQLMKWETPQAPEFRFGMEITMYVANR
jgi:coenzyme PQQ precursor peptide PqqA